MSDPVLPVIPVLDIRRGSTPDVARAAESRLRDLFGRARRAYTPPLLALADHAAQTWLQRCSNPYLGEIDEIATLIAGKGAYALNTSYEWCCTSGVGNDPEGGVRLLRVLDWNLSGLGTNLVAAWQSGPTGEFLNLTWPGFVGVITAMAPGRFAAAINQPPMISFGLSLPVDWIVGRVKLLRSNAIPPAHLLRRVFELCDSYQAAKRMLAETPICLPAFFTLAGTKANEGCVIERTTDCAAITEMPSAIANHWIALPEGGHPRGGSSKDRHCMMEKALHNGDDWQAHPIVNDETRLVAVMNPANGTLSAQGFERTGPATECLLHRARSRPRQISPKQGVGITESRSWPAEANSSPR